METNEELEIVNVMEAATRFAGDVENDPHMWRWVVIALHQAVQGIMVRALMNGTSFPVYNEGVQKKWLAWERGEAAHPKEKLAIFSDLYARIKEPGTGLGGNNDPFRPGVFDDKHIDLLNEIRNEFIHFTPKGWSLDERMFPRMCLGCARVIAFEGWETTNINWYESRCKEAIQKAYHRFIRIMTHLEQRYGVIPALIP